MGERPKTVLARQLGKEDAEAFDAFVRASPFAACQQTRAWAENAPRSRRHDYLYFLCRDSGGVIGTAVIRRTRLAPGVSLATVQRGPVVAEPERLEAVATALKDALKDAGFATLIVGPRIAGDVRREVEADLARCGFRRLPASSQSLHIVTGRIPLQASEEDILAGFKQRGRRSIRKVAGSGVTVREAGEDDFAPCRALIEDFHARRPGYDVAGQLGLEAQARLTGAEGGAMLVAEAGGRIVGYHSFVRQGDSAIWLAMATDDDPQAPRSYLLLWEAVRRARALGLSSYDLAGLSPDEEATGRDQFKQAFAPVREELVPAHVAALRPLRHAIFFTVRQIYRARRKR
jgi:lipid II:glycine glycyltransferase (peptidoglycan interpeptide bridge formation enzyme)